MKAEKTSFDGSLLIKLLLWLLFFLTPLIFYAWATTFNITKETFAELIILVIFTLWFFRLTELGNYHLLKSRLTFPILVFLIILTFSLFQTTDYYTSILDLARWLVYILTYFIIISSIEEEKWVLAMLFASLFAAFLAASYSILQFYGIELPFWRKIGGRMRLFSTFGNPNYLAGYLSACLPLSFMLYLSSEDKLQRSILFPLIAVLYASLLMTFTRGAWIAFFLSAVLVTATLLTYCGRRLFEKNRTKILKLILALLAITAIYSTPNPLNPQGKNVLERGVSAANLEQSSIQQRFLIWLSTLELIEERPLLGWGVGTFGLQYPLAQGKLLSCERYRKYIPFANKSINAHNDYLHLASETGLIGLASFLLIAFLFYRTCFAHLRKRKEERRLEKKDVHKDEFLLIGLMGSATAILAHGLFSFPFHVTQNGLLFFLALSLATLLTERRPLNQKSFEGEKAVENEERRRKVSLITRRALQTGAILIAFSLALLRVRIFIADTHLKTAEMLMEIRAYPAAAEELKTALRIDPHNGLALSDLGQVYDVLGRYEEAIDYLKRAEKNWLYPGLYNNLGYAYVKLKDFERAEKFFRKNIFLFPNVSRAYLNLGNLYLSLGKKALALGKRNLAGKRLDEAFFWFEQARVFDPHLILPLRLSEAYSQLEKNKDFPENGLAVRRILGSPPFFSKEALLDLLPVIRGGNISFKLFFYLPETTSADGALQLRGESKILFERFSVEREKIPSKGCYLLDIHLEEEIPEGSYTVTARLRYGKTRVLVARRKFFIPHLLP